MAKTLTRFPGLLLVIFAGVAAISQAHAAENSHRRTCRLSGGTNWDVRVPGDILTLCRFNNKGISLLALHSYLYEHTTPDAVRAFLSGSTSCANQKAFPHSTTDVDGASVQLCYFRDGSVIEESALVAGPEAAPELANALRNRP